MQTIRSTAELRAELATRRCALVPTMGALHQGHLALVKLGRTIATHCGCPLVVSVFVNPAQFNDPGDLRAYPRPLKQDLAMLSELGVDAAFVPDDHEMYPPGESNAAPQPDVPPVGHRPGLEDRYRPGHFAGVCRVVSRLFDICDPAVAVFGEKDWQQTRVVAAMAEQQGRDTEIRVGPTVREPDGLAMSSRNQHLSYEARSRATGIWNGIRAARLENDLHTAGGVLAAQMNSAGFEVEYAEVRDAESLLPPDADSDRELRILAAGVLDGVRLLDNAPWPA